MTNKKIIIIGAGFTGLTTAYRLSKLGFDVTILESSKNPGGLAAGFKQPRWAWHLEHYYHHLFTSDNDILSLAKELSYQVIFKHPVTSTYTGNQIIQLDSPMSLLRFKAMSMAARIRTGLVIAFLKLTPFWKSLENITAYDFLLKYGGGEAWQILWRPLFEGKFASYSKSISATWFWARIKKRSSSLGYPKGGFGALASYFANRLIEANVKIVYDSPVKSVKRSKSGWNTLLSNGKSLKSDYVLCTLATPLFLKVVKGLPSSYISKLSKMQGIGGLNLVLSLKKSLVPEVYWININDPSMPFLAIVEHTNFMSSAHYNHDHLIYIGSYLDPKSSYYNLSKEELITAYLPHLKKINPAIRKSWIHASWLFKSPFTQPIVTNNYSIKVPSIETPLPGLFLANLQQVYPWDRGTNYAVELGNRAAMIINKYTKES